MPGAAPRRRTAGRARLVVTVTAPDGSAVLIRGLGPWLTRAAPASARGEVTVALVSDGRMRALNRSFRNEDYATDVLSFPATVEGGGRGFRLHARLPPSVSPAASGRYLGDIVIATGVSRRQADETGHSVATELRVLALHGLLHLLGYDHDADRGTMADAEAKLRRKAGLAEGLIERGVTSRLRGGARGSPKVQRRSKPRAASASQPSKRGR